MKIHAKRWNSINFIRAGVRMYAYITDGKRPGNCDSGTQIPYYYMPNDPGFDPGGAKRGSIKDADGLFGKRGAALEDEYFFNEQKRLLQKLRDRLREKRNKRNSNKRNQRDQKKKDDFEEFE